MKSPFPKKTLIRVLAVSLVLIGISSIQAQMIKRGPNGWSLQIPRAQTNMRIQTYPQQPQVRPVNQVQNYPVQPPYQGQPQPQPPQQQYYYPPGSQYPVYVSPNEFKGINPYTGGIDTRNEQVNNTYFDPNRNASRQNGSQRWVRRPVYGANGQITGFEEGYVWNNSHTGVEHGELKTVTENDQGGTHEQIRVQSVEQ